MRHQTFSMPALLVAQLEMAGSKAGMQVFADFVADDSRNLEEARTIVVALSVHGNAETTFSRTTIISLYHELMMKWPVLAASIAGDLLAWECWGFEMEMQRAIDLVQPALEDRITIDRYLLACRKQHR